MLLPDTMELRICVPYNSRSTAWASFDGRGRVELKRTLLVDFRELHSLMVNISQRVIT
jgi:NAD kinase